MFQSILSFKCHQARHDGLSPSPSRRTGSLFKRGSNAGLRVRAFATAIFNHAGSRGYAGCSDMDVFQEV